MEKLSVAETAADEDALAQPSFSEALRVWALIGLTSFGGPAGQIALMHRLLVTQKRWLSERIYLVALNFCTLLPGPEAMQLATYAGWRLHGLKGGLAAGLLFVLPGALVILALSVLYVLYGALPLVAAAFLGIKAAVLAIVIEALMRIARRALKHKTDWIITAVSFLAIYALQAPYPLIVAVAGLIGYLRSNPAPAHPAFATANVRVSPKQTLKTVLIWLSVWIVPLLGVAAIAGPDHVLTKLALFFSKLAVVTFGGAYAVLAYMAQDVVQAYGWLTPAEMVDGLGLAETTPGPLILVTQFVGFISAWRHGGGEPLLMGTLGALVVLWATFAPCFLWIFAGAPYVEAIDANPRLRSALSAITAAVTGVILNLSLWFALHVLFRNVPVYDAAPLHISYPDLATINPLAAVLALAAAVMLFRLHLGVLTTLAISAGLSLLAVWAGAAV